MKKHRFSLAGLVLTAGILSSPSSARGGVNEWTRRGLEGQTISSLAVNPQRPREVYAATGDTAAGIVAC